MVHKKSKIKTIGATSNKPWSYQVANIFGGQIGRYIPNKRGRKGFIVSVSYYIYDLGYPDAPFRVRLYSVDNDCNCPGDDLLVESLIVSNQNGPGWFKVDLSEYSIKFPRNGMYVMMEWVYSGDEYYYDHERIRKSADNGSDIHETNRYYGQSLGNLNKQKNDGCWGRGLGSDWIMYEFFYKGYINVMINAEIAFMKE